MKSLLSKILLGVCALLALFSVFLPYAQIPGVDAMTEFDLEANTISINIGKDITTYNFVSSVVGGSVYAMYSDAEYSKKIDSSALTLESGENTYYLRITATGTLPGEAHNALDNIDVADYTVIIDRGASGQTVASFDEETKTITIKVSGADSTLDFGTIISSTNGWSIYKDDTMTVPYEAKALPLKDGDNVFYATVGLPGSQEGTIIPLKMFEMTVNRDALRQTKPTVSEFGLMYMMQKSNPKYSGDLLIFLSLGIAAVVTLGCFLIPNKFKVIELVLAVLFGAFLIYIPIFEFSALAGAQYTIQYGLFVNIVVGALIIGTAIFNFIAETKEYKAEKKHLEEIRREN